MTKPPSLWLSAACIVVGLAALAIPDAWIIEGDEPHVPVSAVEIRSNASEPVEVAAEAVLIALPYEEAVQVSLETGEPLKVMLGEGEIPSGLVALLPTDPHKAAYFKRWAGDYVILEPRNGKLYPARNQSGCKSGGK